MGTIALNSNAGTIKGLSARTSTTLRITIFDTDGVAKNITGYGFRATYRPNEGGRIYKTWRSSGGGSITLQSAPSGRIELAITDTDSLPPGLHGSLEIVEYSAGLPLNVPTDRFRLQMPIMGGFKTSY